MQCSIGLRVVQRILFLLFLPALFVSTAVVAPGYVAAQRLSIKSEPGDDVVASINGEAGGEGLRLTTAGARLFSLASDGIDGEPEVNAEFGRALGIGDFNNDGFGDLVISTPFLDIDGKQNAGAIHVLYGAPMGPASTGSRFIHQDLLDSGDPTEAGDYFGASLATGDFNGDGYDDLVVGVPNEDDGEEVDSGAIHVLLGAASGLQTVDVRYFDLLLASVGQATQQGAIFGDEVVTGDLNCDGYDDIAIGAPRHDVLWTDLGSVTIVWGSSTGPSTEANTFISPLILDVPAGGNGPGDMFGTSLAEGDFDGDGCDELVVGAPNADGDKEDLGVVFILSGVANGNFPHQVLYPTSYTEWLRFGFALEAGDFDGDGYDDLAVGVPFADVNWFDIRDLNDGIVLIYEGSPAGLDNMSDTSLSPSLSSVPSVEAVQDRFGFVLAAADFDVDGFDDLAVGIPGVKIAGGFDAGQVDVLYGTECCLAGTDAQEFAADTPGIPAELEGSIGFGGAELAAGDLNGDHRPDLAITIRHVDSEPLSSGAVLVLLGEAPPTPTPTNTPTRMPTQTPTGTPMATPTNTPTRPAPRVTPDAVNYLPMIGK